LRLDLDFLVVEFAGAQFLAKRIARRGAGVGADQGIEHTILGGEFDPWQATVAPTLSETTIPNLLPNQGTHPHLRVDFLDDTSDTMHVRVARTWQPQGWPVFANFPPGGPDLLSIDLDGDGKQDVVWAGGDTTATDTSLAARAAVRDSAAIFCVRFDGKGLSG